MESLGKRQGAWLKNWGPRIIIILLGVLWLALIATSWAESAVSAETSNAGDNPSQVDGSAPAANANNNNNDDDYNFNWLDPDKKIYVLQNRRYTKANKVVLSLLGGLGLSNTYRNTKVLEGRAAYFWSEAFGIEVFGTGDFNSGNNALSALQGSIQGVSPVIRDITSEYGIMLDWVPWYAKINVFNSIIYFDWYFSGGVGNLNSTVYPAESPGQTAPVGQSQSNLAAMFGTGHLYHLSDNFLVRLDLKGAAYRAQTFGTTGDNSWYSNFNFTIGVGLKL